LFVHLVKDFMKKLEDVENRLEVSLDRDEIQTLGLKLRFYYSEVRHYQNLFRDILDKIVELQEKFGFQTEDDQWEIPGTGISGDGTQKKDEDVSRLVSEWMSKLEEKGLDPNEVLRSSRRDPSPDSSPSQPDKLELPDIDDRGYVPDTPREEAGVSPASARNVSQLYMRTASGEVGEETAEEVPGLQPPAKDPAGAESGELTLEDVMDGSGAAVQEEEAPEPVEDGVGAGEDVSDEKLEQLLTEVEEDEEAQRLVSMVDITIDEEGAGETGGEAGPEDVEATEGSAGPGAESGEVAEPEPAVDPPGRKLSGVERFLKECSSSAHSLDDLNIVNREIEDYCIKKEEQAREWIEGKNAGEIAEFFSSDTGGLLEYCAAYMAATLGRTGTAINWLEPVVEEGPFSPAAKLLLADLYYKKNIIPRALESYRNAEEAGLACDRSAIGIVRCLRKLGRYGELADEAEDRFLDDPELSMEALYLRAEGLIGAGRATEATGLLKGLMQTAASRSWKARFAILLAELNENSKDIESAIDYYEKSIELEPQNPEAHFSLGRLYLEHKALPLAKNHLTIIVKRFPESLWADRAREIMYGEGIL